jgi:hypothetical protein
VKIKRKDRKPCGARTRSGAPCKNRVTYAKPGGGKCKNHGGRSRGPTTEEGKLRANAGRAKGREVIRQMREAKRAKEQEGMRDTAVQA